MSFDSVAVAVASSAAPQSTPPPAEQPQEQAFRALIRATGLVDRVMGSYFAAFGISGAKWGALRALHRAEGEGRDGLRMTELGGRLLVRQPSVTGIVDRLEREGLVVRDAAPDDQRAKHVRLTSEGRAMVLKVLDVHGAQISRVLGGLGEAEQAQLRRLLDQLSKHLDEWVDAPAE